jgi:hypothetical protein
MLVAENGRSIIAARWPSHARTLSGDATGEIAVRYLRAAQTGPA